MRLGIIRSRDVTVLRHWQRWSRDDNTMTSLALSAGCTIATTTTTTTTISSSSSPTAVVQGSISATSGVFWHYYFLPRDALSCKARYCDCMSSIRLSVCLSVTLVDQDHYSLEILETNCTDIQPSIFAFCSHKATHLLPGEHEEIWGRLEVGWEKVARWGTKEAISLKRVKKSKDGRKVTMEGL